MILFGCTQSTALPNGTAPLVAGKPAIAERQSRWVGPGKTVYYTVWRDPNRHSRSFRADTIAKAVLEVLLGHNANPTVEGPNYDSVVYIIGLEPTTWIVFHGPFRRPRQDSGDALYRSSVIMGPICSGNHVFGRGSVTVWCQEHDILAEKGVHGPDGIGLEGTDYVLRQVEPDTYRVETANKANQ